MVRRVLTPEPTYTEEEREMVYRALVLLAELLTRHEANVIIDATANRRRYRNLARKMITRFGEVYLKCPLQVCMKRERARKERFGAPSSIYRKGRTGASKTVPGVGVPYEEPLSPEVLLDTSRLDAHECADRVVRFIHEKFRPRGKRCDGR